MYPLEAVLWREYDFGVPIRLRARAHFGEERTRMPDELPASVVVAIVESIRRRGMNAFTVEDVATIAGLDPMTIHEGR